MVPSQRGGIQRDLARNLQGGEVGLVEICNGKCENEDVQIQIQRQVKIQTQIQRGHQAVRNL